MNEFKWSHAAASVAIAIAIFAGYHKFRGETAGHLFTITQGQMPPCDSAPVRRLLNQSIAESPRALQTGLKVAQIGSVEDYQNPGGKTISPVSIDPKQDLRFCMANVFTNAGRGDVHFTLTWTDPTKATMWLQVGLLPF